MSMREKIFWRMESKNFKGVFSIPTLVFHTLNRNFPILPIFYYSQADFYPISFPFTLPFHQYDARRFQRNKGQ